MFNYKWNIKDGYPDKEVVKHGLKVFSTFACGGGSTMGYKLAGYDVIGANDIDPRMAKVYMENHNPKFFALDPIEQLLTKELPEELYNLDILDGSPPCSTFSLAGQREKVWKKEKSFREGQSKQILSDLFFDWIALVDRLRPKVAIAENVKGMLIGNAKAYTLAIIKELDKIGYDTQLFLLDGSKMGLPQKRERVFFICKRRDLNLPKINLVFNQEPITIKQALLNIDIPESSKVYPQGVVASVWDRAKPGQKFSDFHVKGSYFSKMRLNDTRVCPTLTAHCQGDLYHWSERRFLTKEEVCILGSFPMDYNFLDNEPGYIVGMSVPPVMMANISYQVFKLLFDR